MDKQIGEKIHRISSGKASANDASESVTLIRKRAELMMPKAFQSGGKKKEAATALRSSQAEIARLRKALLAAYAALDNGAEREDVKNDIHAALKGEPG